MDIVLSQTLTKLEVVDHCQVATLVPSSAPQSSEHDPLCFVECDQVGAEYIDQPPSSSSQEPHPRTSQVQDYSASFPSGSAQSPDVEEERKREKRKFVPRARRKSRCLGRTEERKYLRLAAKELYEQRKEERQLKREMYRAKILVVKKRNEVAPCPNEGRVVVQNGENSVLRND